MKSAYIAVGYQCTHHCMICPLTTYDRLHGKLPYESIMNNIENAKLSVGDHVTISGGEPTLSPFFPDLIRELLARRLRITVLSNGHSFTDSAMVANLANITNGQAFNVVIAVHSSRAALHDTITGTPGSFVESLLAIHMLLNSGIPVTIKHIISKMTVSGLPELADMIIQEFKPTAEVQFTSMDYSGQAAKNAEQLKVTFPEVRPFLDNALNRLLYQSKMPYRVSMIEMPMCACSPKFWNLFHATSQSNIYLAPNAQTNSKMITDLPNQCSAKYPPCEGCDLRWHCPGTWQSAYHLMGPALLTPVKCEYQHSDNLKKEDVTR